MQSIVAVILLTQKLKTLTRNCSRRTILYRGARNQTGWNIIAGNIVLSPHRLSSNRYATLHNITLTMTRLKWESVGSSVNLNQARSPRGRRSGREERESLKIARYDDKEDIQNDKITSLATDWSVIIQ